MCSSWETNIFTSLFKMCKMYYWHQDGNWKVRVNVNCDFYTFSRKFPLSFQKKKKRRRRSNALSRENKIHSPSGWGSLWTNIQWCTVVMKEIFICWGMGKSFCLRHNLTGALGEPKQPGKHALYICFNH